MRRTVLLAVALVVLTACDGPEPIRKDSVAPTARVTNEAGAASPPASAVGDAAVEADGADGDACVPGDVWDARIRVRKTWHGAAQMKLQGPLELVVPRAHARKIIYEDCGMTGGGCGDCGKAPVRDGISCERTPSHVHVDIGLDDVGPTYVEIVQRGRFIVAEWTRGGWLGGPGTGPAAPTRSTRVLLTLPCAVRVRFVR
jgi:hypothetical protein